MFRLTGRQRGISVETFWGGRFTGIVPEAVTTMIRRTGYLDAPVCRALLQHLHAGNVFLDVGAHFGFFSLLASQVVGYHGRIVSVEAMPSTFSQLERNVLENAPFENIATIQCAAGDKAGELEFSDFGLTFSSLNSAFDMRGPRARRRHVASTSVTVQVEPLDDIVERLSLARLDLVKIDTESSEHLVLAGFERSLRRFSPKVCIEVSDATPEEAEHSEHIISFMRENGYRPFRYYGSTLVEVRKEEPTGYDNFLFLKEG